MCTYYIVFIHSSVNGHPSWFHILLQNMQGQMPLQHTDLNSFVYVPNRGVVGSHTVLVQVFWEPFIVIFHNRYANLHSYQECMRVPFSLYGMRWYLIVVLIYTSWWLVALSTFSYIWAFVYSLEKCLLRSLPMETWEWVRPTW
jgi:hypothetical protein